MEPPYDPYFLQSEFEVLNSQLVLTNVIERLHLDERWGQLINAGIVLPPTEVLLLLKRQLDLRLFRNTSVFDIRVFSLNQEGREPAEIANAIAESYKHLRTTVRVEILDHAEPSTRPVRPNIPMNLTLGAALGMVLGLMASGLTLLLAAVKQEPTGLNSGPTGKAPEGSLDGSVEVHSAATARRSSLAIIGAAWAGLFVLNYFLAYTPPGWAITRAIRNNLGNVISGVIYAPLMLVGFSAPIGVTVLGWLALRQIRKARGGLRAFGLAMFDVLLFPLLILDGWLVWLGKQTVVQVLMPDRAGGGSWLWGSWVGLVLVLVLAAFNLVLIRWSWHAARRFVNRPPPVFDNSGNAGVPAKTDARSRHWIKRFTRRLALVVFAHVILLETLNQLMVHWRESSGELWTMAFATGSIAALVWAAWPLYWRTRSVTAIVGAGVALSIAVLALDGFYNLHLRPNLGLYQEDGWVAQHPGFQWGWRQGIAAHLWNKPVAPPFGPAKEIVLAVAGDHPVALLNLASGTQVTRDEFDASDPAILDWARSQALDLAATVKKGQVTVLGLDLGVVSASHLTWESITPQNVANYWCLERQSPPGAAPLSLSKTQTGQFVFRTREGGMGVMQLLGPSDQPAGVKIRYRQVGDTRPLYRGDGDINEPSL